jgi:hypothetical protein
MLSSISSNGTTNKNHHNSLTMKLLFALLLVAGAARGQTHIAIMKTDGKGHLDKTWAAESKFSMAMLDDTLFIELDFIPRFVKINGINWEICAGQPFEWKLGVDTTHEDTLPIEQINHISPAGPISDGPITVCCGGGYSISSGFTVIGTPTNAPKRETVPVIMLVSDTTHEWIRGINRAGKDTLIETWMETCEWMHGFEVRLDSAYHYRKYHDPNHDNGYGGTTAMGGFFTDEIGHVYTHLGYLGPDRKQLKNIIVWLTK